MQDKLETDDYNLNNSIEKKHVRDIYKNIAKEFDRTRGLKWPCVCKFLEDIPKYSFVADIGCGNGRNMMMAMFNDKKFNYIGCDFLEEFTDICANKSLNVNISNILNLCYKDCSFDAVMNIAVIHHLSTPIRRERAVKELIRIAKPNSKILITVWGFEDYYKYNKRKLIKIEYNNDDIDADTNNHTKYDFLVDWNNENSLRYYHLFTEENFKKMITNVIKIEEFKCKDYSIYSERGNWIAILNK